MLYVLYVRGGYELEILEQLRRKEIPSYCPRQLKAERRRGAWQYVERIFFPGYIFIDVPTITATLWHKTMKCAGALRFVSMCSLLPDEEDYIRRLCNNGDCIDISRGYVSKGKLHITNGFLKCLEHEIVRFNRRGKRAAADVTIYGEKHRIVFSLEFDAPPANA